MLISHRGWSKECSCVFTCWNPTWVSAEGSGCVRPMCLGLGEIDRGPVNQVLWSAFSETERSALSQGGSQRWPGVPTKLWYSSKPLNSCYKWSYQWSINIKAMPQTKQSHYDQSFGVNLRAERWGRHKLGCWSQTPSQQVLGEQRGRPSAGSPPPHYSASGSYQVPPNLLS